MFVVVFYNLLELVNVLGVISCIFLELEVFLSQVCIP